MVTQNTDRLLSEVECATLLKIKKQTLSVWRSAKRYPLPYVKVGRAVRYRLSDIEKFLEQRTIGVTEEK